MGRGDFQCSCHLPCFEEMNILLGHFAEAIVTKFMRSISRWRLHQMSRIRFEHLHRRYLHMAQSQWLHRSKNFNVMIKLNLTFNPLDKVRSLNSN